MRTCLKRTTMDLVLTMCVLVGAVGLVSSRAGAQGSFNPPRNVTPVVVQPTDVGPGSPGWEWARLRCGRGEPGYTLRKCIDCCAAQFAGGHALGACLAQCASRPLEGNPMTPAGVAPGGAGSGGGK